MASNLISSAHSFGAQWQRLHTLWENISDQTESSQSKQVLYCTTVLLLHCLYKYACQIEPQQFAVPPPGNTASSSVILVEAIKPDSISLSEPMPKKLKRELTPPELTVSASISNAAELTDAFLTAVRCWQLLHSRELLSKEFSKLMQHWQSHTWPWLSDFQIDLLVYQGFYKDALLQLQHKLQQQDTCSQITLARGDLQAACCHYCLGNYAQGCEHVMRVVGCLPVSTEPPTSSPRSLTEGRQVQILSCRESEVFPYCVQLLISSFMEKVFNASMPDDMSLGHMIVLMQYDWSKYEQLFCEVLHKIHQQGHFTYNLFFNYVINIDILEEFAYLKIHEGGRINLDILPTSTKQIVQTRTVTRGVNKGVKQDFQAALEKQVIRSEENIENIIRHFFVDERDLLLHHLM
ncbi:hypothetical protein LSH36_28g03070 [Paralvinella palmiformis]|uniref:Integrator complex subunit 10 n=1 Tax=Paralvinella palmiformis TaxID=53620 RepID=A0AAD9KB30_9ANNE|nr:hypothetical protein LSH36_28g03070 [Paralvinella palmiformis]